MPFSAVPNSQHSLALTDTSLLAPYKMKSKREDVSSPSQSEPPTKKPRIEEDAQLENIRPPPSPKPAAPPPHEMCSVCDEPVNVGVATYKCQLGGCRALQHAACVPTCAGGCSAMWCGVCIPSDNLAYLSDVDPSKRVAICELCVTEYECVDCTLDEECAAIEAAGGVRTKLGECYRCKTSCCDNHLYESEKKRLHGKRFCKQCLANTCD